MATVWTNREKSTQNSAPAQVAKFELTWEMGLYGLIFVAGLILRFAALGRWPLLESEAGNALAAWRAHLGSLERPASYSPLIFDANLLLFALARASDAAVRLLPALSGSLLVIVLYGARHLLGRRAGLVAAILAAGSPTLLFFSRTADGTILAALFGAAFAVALARYWVRRQPKDLYLAGIALGLGLASGSGIYTTLSGLALAWLAATRFGRDEPDPAPGAPGWLVGVDRRRVVLYVLGAFLLAASALSANPHGLAASVSLAGRWFKGWALGLSALPLLALWRNLALYEFVILSLALVGLVWGLIERHRLDQFLAAWALWVLLLGLLPGHRGAETLVQWLLPLLALAGRGAARLWEALSRGLSWVDGVAGGVGLTLFCFAAIELASYLHTGQEQFLSYGQISIGIFLIAFAAYWFWGERHAALRLLVLVAAFFLLVLGVHTMVSLNYRTARDPREPLLVRPVSTQLRDAIDFVTLTSSRQAGDPHALELFYEEALDPWLGWYLRDFEQARTVPSIQERYEAMVLIEATHDGEPVAPGFAGQRFRLYESYPEQELSMRQRVRWFVYRDPVGFEQAQELRVLVALGAR